jgi:branched chain amino acid efflux pump
VTPDARVVVAVLLLAAGTFALRLAGPGLRARLRSTAQVRSRLDAAVAVLLCAVVATSTLLEGQEWAGAARPVGVATAGLLAWWRAPFVVVVLAASATTAGLRLVGLR